MFRLYLELGVEHIDSWSWFFKLSAQPAGKARFNCNSLIGIQYRRGTGTNPNRFEYSDYNGFTVIFQTEASRLDTGTGRSRSRNCTDIDAGTVAVLKIQKNIKKYFLFQKITYLCTVKKIKKCT